MKILFLIVLLFSCSSVKERPNTQILTHVMSAPKIVDNGNMNLLKVLESDTTIVVSIKGIVEPDSSFSYISIIKPEHQKFQNVIKEYIKTVKFKPAHYYKDNRPFRQIWVLPVTLQRRKNTE